MERIKLTDVTIESITTIEQAKAEIARCRKLSDECCEADRPAIMAWWRACKAKLDTLRKTGSPFIDSLAKLDREIKAHGRDTVLFPELRK